MFGGGVVANYLHRAADPFELNHGLNFKCLVDLARMTEVGVHCFAIDGRHEGGERRRPARNTCRARLQLNHYYTRSNAELQAKIGRGSNKSVQADKHIARVMRIVTAIEAETVEDRTAIAFLTRSQPPRP